MVLQQGKQDQQQTLESAVEKVIQRSSKYDIRSAWACVAALTNTKRDPSNFITISDAGIANNSEKTKEAVLKIVSPVAEKLKVKHIKKISGNGILVETAGQKDLTTLLKYRKLREAGFVVNVPAKKCPRVIIYDISRANNDEEIMKALIEQNLETNTKEMFRRQVRLAFKTGDRKKERLSAGNWVLETSKEAREILIKRRENLHWLELLQSTGLSSGDEMLQVPQLWTYSEVLPERQGNLRPLRRGRPCLQKLS
ncbi:uncharacterized protein LOC133667561 [Apis cerana]|uniref:uncharacterized protein LOC133667561 n=1 Tax=Apis cerana TaxID=7461 RepID=UPI002B238469|nr:uncharacterized protein LOC133667561 [Apis cerana]